MKLSVLTLREFVNTALDTQAIGDLLTMAGFELEGIDEAEGQDVLDIKVMANRGDGLSALGLAREILAKDPNSTPTELYQRASGRFAGALPGGPTSGAKVAIESPNCTRYACLVYKGITNGASPDWLQKRLRATGQKSISLLVDLTNYVMLELGQPLHAFDLDKLQGGQIVVRQAREGEKLTTLDGSDHELQANQLMICDQNRPVAAAGIMGGQETEVSASTTNMLLESAHFVNTSVRKTRKQLALNTDASYRFERSVDPEGVVAALARFAELLQAETGAKPYGGAIDVYPAPASQKPVKLRLNRAEALLGMPVAENEAVRALNALGFELNGSGGEFTVTPPTWRTDIQREDDVVEDLARVIGYEKIPETQPKATMTRGGVFDIPALIDVAREAMLRCGFTQVMNHTLQGKHPLDFRPQRRVGPRNPHSPEIAYMRDSLLPGLAEAAQRNGARNLHLFEIGRVFVKGEYQIDESPELSILSVGDLDYGHWVGGDVPKADFYSLKGVVEELAADLGDHVTFDYPRDPDPRFHPTRQSGVLLDNNRSWAGTIGQIHPNVAEELGLPYETFLAELDLLVFAIHDNAEPQLKSFSRNPAIRRDIAFVISKEVAYKEIDQAIRNSAGPELEKHWLFDIYSGKGIEDGYHSLAIALQIRKLGENLTDEQANAVRDRILEPILALGATMR